MTALTIAVIGATTVMAPLDRRPVEGDQREPPAAPPAAPHHKS